MLDQRTLIDCLDAQFVGLKGMHFIRKTFSLCTFEDSHFSLYAFCDRHRGCCRPMQRLVCGHDEVMRSSFSPPTFLPRSRAGVVPRAQPRWRGGPAPESAAVRAHAREAGAASPSSAFIPVPPVSPRQFLVPLPATRVAG